MSLFFETGQSLRDYVIADNTPGRILSLVGRKVLSADKNNPKHGTITGFSEGDPDEFIIEWDDGDLSETHWNNRFVTLVEVL